VVSAWWAVPGARQHLPRGAKLPACGSACLPHGFNARQAQATSLEQAVAGGGGRAGKGGAPCSARWAHPVPLRHRVHPVTSISTGCFNIYSDMQLVGKRSVTCPCSQRYTAAERSRSWKAAEPPISMRERPHLWHLAQRRRQAAQVAAAQAAVALEHDARLLLCVAADQARAVVLLVISQVCHLVGVQHNIHAVSHTEGLPIDCGLCHLMPLACPRGCSGLAPRRRAAASMRGLTCAATRTSATPGGSWLRCVRRVSAAAGNLLSC
jgi:hypothetical protein